MMRGMSSYCRTKNLKSISTTMNTLGWGVLCPEAMELIKMGATQLSKPTYPTGNMQKKPHDKIVELIEDLMPEVLEELGQESIDLGREKETDLLIHLEKDLYLCSYGKADLVYLVKNNAGILEKNILLLYIEVSSTKINVAKPYQAILRGISLYYRYHLPVAIVVVSPTKVCGKLLRNKDSNFIYKRIKRSVDDYFKPNPNLCSLCELSHFCPLRMI